MSDHPRLRRSDPERSAPIRDWSNMFRSPVSPAAGGVANGAGAANESAAEPRPAAALSEEARAGIETAYRVIDEHLQEGRRAAQAQSGREGGAAPPPFIAAGPAGVAISTDSIQEMVAQGIRFYSSFAPLLASIVTSIANAPVLREAAAAALPAAPLAPPPWPRNAAVAASLPVIIEIASSRMTRVTVKLEPEATPAHLAIGGLLALDPDKPPLKEMALAVDPGSNSIVVRIRIPESQPAGLYSGTLVDRESGEPRGTISLRIDA